MTNKNQYTANQVADALTKARGLISAAAEDLGCTPQTVRNYIEKYVTVQQALQDARERTVDRAELKMMVAIENGEPWAVALVLKTLGKGRGYVERVETTGKDGGPVAIERITIVEPNGSSSDKTE